MATTEALEFNYESIGRGGKVRLSARLPDGSSFTDKIDVTDAQGRERFLCGLCKNRKGLDRKEVVAALERIAAELVRRPDRDKGEGNQDKGKVSKADLIVATLHEVEGVELFHTPGGNDAEAHVTFPRNGHLETWAVRSKGFRTWLARLFYQQFGKVPGSQAMQDALAVIEGIALHSGPEHAVAVRVAEHGGAIWLDLADEAWRVVQITVDGWRVTAKAPVKFVRKRGMLPLPCPVQGGSVAELWPFLNLRDKEDRILFASWLVNVFRPGRPFPLLTVNGEQGSAKTSLCRMAKATTDPNVAPLRRPPRTDRDLMIAASNSWVVGFDNLSGLSQDLSDALCCLATGGGYGTRELYTDDEEKLFQVTRPVIINGIEDIISRPDLLDRAVTLTLGEIPEENRRDEDELWRAFERVRPRVLGALLDAVSRALKGLPGVKLARKPRMADFALWSVAAAPALSWTGQDFLDAYAKNRGQANAQALEGSLVTPAIFRLMDNRAKWAGTVKELLDELNASSADEQTRKQDGWPKRPRGLSGELRRLAPNLRREKLDVSFGKRTRHGTPVTLEWTSKPPSPPSPPSSGGPKQATACGVGGDGGDGGFQPDSGPARDADEEVVEWTG
jgi:hypothetical protein